MGQRVSRPPLVPAHVVHFAVLIVLIFVVVVVVVIKLEQKFPHDNEQWVGCLVFSDKGPCASTQV